MSSLLRILLVNAHVGLGFRFGAMLWLLRHTPRLDIILIQEGRYMAVVRRALGRGWIIYPHDQPGSTPKTEAMTYVAVRKKRFLVVGRKNEPMPDGPYPRRMTALVLVDRRTDLRIAVSSVHPDPLGKGFDKADDGAKNLHIRQVREYAKFFDGQPNGTVRIAGGDWNESVFSETSKDSARDQMSEVRMTPMFRRLKEPGKVGLDEVFGNWNDHLEAVSRRSIRVPVRGMDHPATLATVKVTR